MLAAYGRFLPLKTYRALVMDDRRKTLEDLAASIVDRSEVALSQAVKLGADIQEVLAANRAKLAEVSSDFDEREASLLKQLYSEEVERRAKISSEALLELENKREIAKSRWMVDGKISREKVREYVRNDLDALNLFARNGGNRHQMVLDQQDALADLLDGLDNDDMLKIINMQTEEILAEKANLDDELYKKQSAQLESIDLDAQPSTVELESSPVKGVFLMLAFVILVVLVIFKVSS